MTKTTSKAAPPPAPHPGSPGVTGLDHHNFRQLYYDISWWGLCVGTTLSFITVYATRLGATPFQISLFSSGVAVISLITSIPAGRWLEGRPLIPTVSMLALATRIWFAALVVLPWLWGDNAAGQVVAVIGLYLMSAVFGIALGIGFNALYAEVVPPELRTQILGYRLALHSLIVCLSSLGAGQLLDRIPFPVNYQIVFSIGALGGLMTSFQLRRLKSHKAALPALNPLPRYQSRTGLYLRHNLASLFPASTSGKPLLRWDLIRGEFGRFLAIYLIFHIAVYMAIPLHPILTVRLLKLSDRAISIGPILTYGILGLTSIIVSRYSTRLPERRLVMLSVILYGLQSFCLMFAQGADLWYWASALSVGVAAALLGIGLTNRLMSRVPEDDRPAHMALWTLAVHIGVLLGSALGPWASEVLGLRPTMGIAAAGTLVSVALIRRWG